MVFSRFRRTADKMAKSIGKPNNTFSTIPCCSNVEGAQSTRRRRCFCASHVRNCAFLTYTGDEKQRCASTARAKCKHGTAENMSRNTDESITRMVTDRGDGLHVTCAKRSPRQVLWAPSITSGDSFERITVKEFRDKDNRDDHQ